MGKYSRNSERVEREWYPTPFAAVPPLVAHLRGDRIVTFAEPCCGDGRLIRHLGSFGFACVHHGDLATGQDARDETVFGGADAIVTNPPYDRSRRLLRELIRHFLNYGKPVWLLLEFSWARTARAAPLQGFCSDIVPVPRLVFQDDTDTCGKVDHAWFRYDPAHRRGTKVHPAATFRLRTGERHCHGCGKPFRAKRSDARTCSDPCRRRANRRTAS
jgi:hypothetical protein